MDRYPLYVSPGSLVQEAGSMPFLTGRTGVGTGMTETEYTSSPEVPATVAPLLYPTSLAAPEVPTTVAPILYPTSLTAPRHSIELEDTRSEGEPNIDSMFDKLIDMKTQGQEQHFILKQQEMNLRQQEINLKQQVLRLEEMRIQTRREPLGPYQATWTMGAGSGPNWGMS